MDIENIFRELDDRAKSRSRPQATHSIAHSSVLSTHHQRALTISDDEISNQEIRASHLQNNTRRAPLKPQILELLKLN